MLQKMENWTSIDNFLPFFNNQHFMFPPNSEKKYRTVRNFVPLRLGGAGITTFSRKYRPLYDYLQTK